MANPPRAGTGANQNSATNETPGAAPTKASRRITDETRGYGSEEIKMLWANPTKTRIPTPDEALPGRATPLPVPERHAVLDAPLAPPSG